MPWDKTENEIRHRIREPSEFEPDSFRYKQITDGVSLVLGKLKGKSGADDPMVTQAIRFDSEKFTMEQAKAWFEKHKKAFSATESEQIEEALAEAQEELTTMQEAGARHTKEEFALIDQIIEHLTKLRNGMKEQKPKDDKELEETVPEEKEPHLQYAEGEKPSFEQIHRMLSQALSNNGNSKAIEGESAWIREVYDDHCIIQEKGKFFSMPYTIMDDKVTFGERTEVALEFVPIKESVQLREQADPEGWAWEVVLIEVGTSINKVHYTRDTLKAAIPLFEGAKAYASTDAEHVDLQKKTVRDMVGWYDNVRFDTFQVDGKLKEGLLATFHILKSEDWLRIKMKDSIENGQPNLIGFSIDAEGTGTKKDSVLFPDKINRVLSVDVVANPAAGGRLIRMVASVNSEVTETVQTKELEMPDEVKVEETQKNDEIAIKMAETESKVQEALKSLELQQWRLRLKETVIDAKLPELAGNRIFTMFENTPSEVTKVQEAIQAEKDYLAILAPQFAQTVTVGTEPNDRFPKAMDGFFEGKDVDGVPRFRSLKEAYCVIKGIQSYYFNPLSLIRESYSYQSPTEFGIPNPKYKLQEVAVYVATWGQILGDSITRKMQKEYSSENLQEWRKVVSDVTSVTDFRTQRRTRVGGFATLSTVAEGTAYTIFAQEPVDEEATYAATKKGNLQGLTLEAIANDDIGAMRRIPVNLGRSAAATLNKFVFDHFVNGWTSHSPEWTTTYDSGHLFNAVAYTVGGTGHQNTTNATIHAGAALAQASLAAAITSMRRQPAYGITLATGADALGSINSPKYLLVSPDLEDLGYRLVSSRTLIGATNAASSEPNLFTGRYNMELIVVDYWTEDHDWYLVADPAKMPTIEVGFFNGQETPELFVADQQQYAMDDAFTADKTTYKIRFIFGGCVLDHRGLYGENVT